MSCFSTIYLIVVLVAGHSIDHTQQCSKHLAHHPIFPSTGNLPSYWCVLAMMDNTAQGCSRIAEECYSLVQL